MGKVNEKLIEDLEFVSEGLSEAAEVSLVPEVVLYALYHMQDMEGQSTIEDALDAGIREWDV